MKNKQAFIKFIQESRALLPTATPAQKIRLLKLIKENYKRLKEENEPLPLLLVENELDYLPEN